MVIVCTMIMISMFITEARTPAEFDKIFDRVQSLYDKSEYDKALKEMSVISEAELIEADDTTKVFYNTLKGKIFLFKQENDSAKQYLSEAITLYESLRFKYPSYIDLLVYRAYASDALDERDEAARWYRKTLIKGRVVEHNNDIDNNCYLNLANIHNEAGEYEQAIEYYKKISWVDSLQKVEIHPLYFSKLSERYIAHSKNGNLQQAKMVNDSLINYCKTKYGENHEYYLIGLQSESSLQNSWGNYKSAEIANKEIIRIGKSYKLVSNIVATAYIDLIDNFCKQDSLNLAIEIFPEAIDYIKEFEGENISVFQPCFSIGTTAVNIGEYEVGIMALEKFISNSPIHMQWGLPYAFHYLTWAYLNTGRNQDVVDILTPMLKNSAELPDIFNDIVPFLHKTLGCSYYVLGDREKSLEHLNKAISLQPETMSNDSLILDIFKELEVK